MDTPVQINRSYAAPTPTRLDDIYVVLYVNLARLLVQGIIPFICLIFFNYRIYWVMKRRRNMTNRPLQNSNHATPAGQAANGNQLTSQQKKANEAQQAVVLFVIVLNFFFCHSLRFALNVHEFLTLDTLRAAIADDSCDGFSYWAFSAASISHCLMTLNSSMNFFIYACTSSTFRAATKKKILPSPLVQCLLNLRERMKRSTPVNDDEHQRPLAKDDQLPRPSPKNPVAEEADQIKMNEIVPSEPKQIV